MTGRQVEARLAELRGHPLNYNKHSEGQIGRLMASLERFGQPKPIVIWAPGGLDTAGGQPTRPAAGAMIIAGHGLVEAARRLKWETLLASDVSEEWTEAEATAFVGADNELARLADPDEAALAALVASLADVDAELASLAAGSDERLRELLAGLAEPAGEDPGAQIDKAEELRVKWGVEPGQLWQLGEHRLICGDCTDAAVVARVMGDAVGDLWLTDPPYAVSYADKNAYLNSIAPGNRIQVPIVNDHLSLEDAADLWQRAAVLALEFCADHASYYWFACQGGDQMMMMMMMRLSEAGWRVRHELIWVKNNHVLGRTDYNYKHEPILYGWKKDGKHKFFGGFQTSVLEFPKPQSSGMHPTTKPVELVERLIVNSSQTGQVVYDGFLGSGTTLIACERLGRRCRAVEIEPGYVAVALERWAVMTGGRPAILE